MASDSARTELLDLIVGRICELEHLHQSLYHFRQTCMHHRCIGIHCPEPIDITIRRCIMIQAVEITVEQNINKLLFREDTNNKL